jgi:opacity protein-like surface antigen
LALLTGCVARLGWAVVMFVFVVSGARAQNCPTLGPVQPTGAGVVSTASAVAANAAADITAANTAFLTQSSAFIGAPPNPEPNQPGGGIWTRAVGGRVDITSASTSTNTFQQPVGNPVGSTTVVPCSTKVRSNFDGVQLGADLGRFNWNGWNVHWGLTAGSLYTNNSVVGGSTVLQNAQGATAQAPFDSSAQIPFIGGYAAVTNGGFFADFLVRADAYQMSFDSPANTLFNQNTHAHGLSVGGSMGYHYVLPNSGGWFIEPSAGGLYSKVSIDPINLTGSPTSFVTSPFPATLPGTLTLNDITETIGRIGIRAGKSFSYGDLNLEPFAAVSVWHNFSGSTTGDFVSCPGCLHTGPPENQTGVGRNAITATNIGTYGQYSLGLAGGLANTGWLGFVRVDYRNGADLKGWDATGGIRYQLNPNKTAPAIPVKALPSPPTQPISWTGFYIGGIGGAQQGKAQFGYPGGSADPGVAGILGGVTTGYNWQRGMWVFGLEGDWTWTDAKGGVGCGPVSFDTATNFSSPLYQMTCNGQETWVATITPRLGIAWDRVLLFVKGGIAFTREQFTATCNFGLINGRLIHSVPGGLDGVPGQACAPAVPTSPFSTSNGFSASDKRAGGTVGFGAEFALTPNWSTKLEADYVDFGTHTLIASDGTPINAGMHAWQGKIGVNYRFFPGAF